MPAIEGLIERSTSAQSVEDVHQLCSNICYRLGFERFIYGAQFPTSFVNPDYVIISGFPAEWWSRYSTEGYMQIDPMVAHCNTRIVPLRWDEIDPGEGAEAGKVRKFMDEACKHGLRSGASFPIHGCYGESGMLSLVVNAQNSSPRCHVLETMAMGQMLSGYVHEAVKRIVIDKDAPIGKVQLTERERECLTWAAEGKTAWETGQILKISERTVTFHLQNAAEKLQVANRIQAVAKAISQQLITPQRGVRPTMIQYHAPPCKPCS